VIAGHPAQAGARRKLSTNRASCPAWALIDSATSLASPRRFHRRVQGQDVGLEGDPE